MTMGTDNVSHQATARHQGENQNKFYMWAMSFIAINRVQTTLMSLNDRIRAEDISIKKFIPSDNIINSYRDNLVDLVQSILYEHIDIFKKLRIDFKHKVNHQYAKEMSLKSQVVCLLFCSKKIEL